MNDNSEFIKNRSVIDLSIFRSVYVDGVRKVLVTVVPIKLYYQLISLTKNVCILYHHIINSK